MTGAAALEVRGVTRTWFPGTPDEVRALEGVDVRFEPGGLQVLWGPSGSGKTTLLSLMGALDHPDGGTILHGERPLGTLTEPELALYRRHTVGLMFQDPRLLPGVPLWANLTLALIPDGHGPGARRERALRLLDPLGLAAKVDRPPEQLSGGEARRAALARALVRNPEILLVDEPTSSLDPENGARVTELLRDLAGAGRIVVVATHERSVRDAAVGVTFLDRGRIVPGPGPGPGPVCLSSGADRPAHSGGETR